MKRLNILILVTFLFPALVFAAPPTNAVKFFIVDPDDSVVGASVTITVEARKQNNQVDTAYQNDVTLVTSGSATGGGLVNIVNGVGTLAINDLVAETVTLSLSDTEATGLDVSSTQNVVFSSAEAASWRQQSFRFRDDDGTEISATGFGASDAGENSNLTDREPGTVFRLRFQIKVAQANGSISPRLEFREGNNCVSGDWTVVTSGSAPFHLRPSSLFVDGASTTQQLTGGPNFVAGKIFESTNPANSISLLKNESSEYEWSLNTSANVLLNTTYSFRITNNGVALDNYIQCPTLKTFFPPAPGGAVTITTVTFSGKAFPGASVFIVDKDANFERTISQDLVSSDDGSFKTTFLGILQSQHSFGIMIKDKEGNTTQSKFFNVDTISDSLTAKNIIVPPTVGMNNSSVRRGNNAVISGYTVPESSVMLEIDGKIKKEAKSDKDGLYKLDFPTGELEFGQHSIKTKLKESSFSPTKTFVVSRLIAPKTDLSGDGKMDIKDWSIFLSRWGSKDKAQKKLIDLNEDGKIDISDFSIFIKAIRTR